MFPVLVIAQAYPSGIQRDGTIGALLAQTDVIETDTLPVPAYYTEFGFPVIVNTIQEIEEIRGFDKVVEIRVFPGGSFPPFDSGIATIRKHPDTILGDTKAGSDAGTQCFPKP